MTNALTLVATTAFGLESLAAHELRTLGYPDVQVENGRVTFQGDWKAVARTNTWLRTAERVLVKLGEFPARTFDDLFDQTKALPWDEILPEDAFVHVEGKSHLSQLSSVPACQGIVKKAVIEAMKRRYKRERFEETGPRFKVLVDVRKDIATLTIDTTGTGLHKRGYRKLTAQAPLRETLAASLILLSRWNPDRTLVDPLCGSGTIPIEAGLIARNIAPGLFRDFDASNWPVIPQAVWKETREEAQDLMRREAFIRGIYGSDQSAEVLVTARYHAKLAGLEDVIHFEKKAVQDFSSRKKYGYIITNPPYGERLGDKPEVDKLYADMGRVFKPLETWSFFIITPHPDFERLFDRVAHKKRKLYNGNIRCDLYQYFGPRPPRDEAPADREQLADPQY